MGDNRGRSVVGEDLIVSIDDLSVSGRLSSCVIFEV
jgi:hypothetical protein